MSLTNTKLFANIGVTWACGAAGSAPEWHSGGQGFDPPQVHHFWTAWYIVSSRFPLFPVCVAVYDRIDDIGPVRYVAGFDHVTPVFISVNLNICFVSFIRFKLPV